VGRHAAPRRWWPEPRVAPQLPEAALGAAAVLRRRGEAALPGAAAVLRLHEAELRSVGAALPRHEEEPLGAAQ
jgi:hypothetical protein